MKRSIHICCFDSTLELKGRKLTYENLKALVLEAGRFSVFEATATQKRAELFTELCRDPELVTANVGFPWTNVRRRDPVVRAGSEPSGAK